MMWSAIASSSACSDSASASSARHASSVRRTDCPRRARSRSRMRRTESERAESAVARWSSARSQSSSACSKRPADSATRRMTHTRRGEIVGRRRMSLRDGQAGGGFVVRVDARGAVGGEHRVAIRLAIVARGVIVTGDVGDGRRRPELERPGDATMQLRLRRGPELHGGRRPRARRARTRARARRCRSVRTSTDAVTPSSSAPSTSAGSPAPAATSRSASNARPRIAAHRDDRRGAR